MKRSTRKTVRTLTRVLLVGLAAAIVTFGIAEHRSANHLRDVAAYYQGKYLGEQDAADAFRQELENRTNDLVDAYKHLSIFDPGVYADKVAYWTTPPGNDHKIAALASQISHTMDPYDWHTKWSEKLRRVASLRVKYAAAIHAEGDFTYIDIPKSVLGPVVLNGHIYILDYQSVDGLPAVVLES